MGTKVFFGEITPRERSIQAGSLCYNNRCVVELLPGVDSSPTPPARRTGVCAPEAKAADSALKGRAERLSPSRAHFWFNSRIVRLGRDCFPHDSRHIMPTCDLLCPCAERRPSCSPVTGLGTRIKKLKKDFVSSSGSAPLGGKADGRAVWPAVQRQPYQSLFGDACPCIHPGGWRKIRCRPFCWKIR